jgi:hypothetical protein
MIAFSNDTAYVAPDGVHYSEVALPSIGTLATAAAREDSSTHQLILALVSVTGPPGSRSSTLVLSRDSGRSFERPPSAVWQRAELGIVAVLSGDRIIAGTALPDASGQAGVRCSPDGGTSWQHTC